MKKGSISLSINMIVVVVLAFVMLGLMLTLGRQIVNNAIDASMDIAETTQQQIMDDLQRGDKPLSFPNNKITVELGSSETIAVGIKNTYSGDKFFKLQLKAIDVDGNEVDVSNRIPVIMNYDYEISGDTATRVPGSVGRFQFSSINYKVLGPTETELIPIIYEAKGAPKNTFSFKLEILEADDEDGTNERTYASKSFFITVT